jgi:dephospho-CoA kinase
LLRIGITGGIGSGKSTICKIFEKTGIPIFSADSAAHQVSNGDQDVRRRILKLLGDKAYNARGELDRSFVAGEVFSNPDTLKGLNRIIHPRVLAMAEKFGRTAVGAPFWIAEAALMYESGLHKKLDYIIVVTASEEERVRRVMQRDGVTGDIVRRRMEYQLSDEELRANADFILMNDGDLDHLQERVNFFLLLFSKIPSKMA